MGGGTKQSTDDAYLIADLTPLSTKTSGVVARVNVADYRVGQAQAEISAAQAGIVAAQAWQCGIAQIENEGWLPRESDWRGYIWTATVAGRVN